MEKQLTVKERDGILHIEYIGFNSFELMGIHQFCLSQLITKQPKLEKEIVMDAVINAEEVTKLRKKFKNNEPLP